MSNWREAGVSGSSRGSRTRAGEAPSLLNAVCPAPLSEQERIVLGHGSGGKLTQRLLEEVFYPAFANPALDRREDQAALGLDGGGGARLALTTDSFVVTPIFFPGGDIGSLAVHGTVNDLAMGGARPLALAAAFILEEGLARRDLDRVVASMAGAARAVPVPIATGDTKVVNRGHGDQVFITTTGVGLLPPGEGLGAERIRPGDHILLSGTLGDHGLAILSQRENLAFEEEIVSDSACLWPLVEDLLRAVPEGAVRCLRDPTRGGLGTVLQELAQRAGVGMVLRQEAVPVREAVASACELLGLDPLYIANEGKLVAVVAPEAAEAALEALRGHRLGREARRVGEVLESPRGMVLLATAVGGTRVLDAPFHEQLPRIC